jgi:hypothetical protein
MLFVVNLLLMLTLGAAAFWRFTVPVLASESAPADVFMESIAAEDGDLGWNQLCPELQAQLPRDTLVHQSELQRAIQNHAGVTLSIDYVGGRPRPIGGEIRFYVANAYGTDGSTGQKTYVVQTQASGCVESVQ